MDFAVSSIPQDIIDDIVDTLPTEDLNNCSLVSPSFLVPCQKRIFSIICLGTWGQRICKRLYALLSASPHLVFYIREVHIVDRGFTPASGVTDKGWVPDEETLPLMLQLLRPSSGLRAFSLVFKPFTDVEWACLPWVLKCSILDLCRSPNLTSVRLVGMWADDFPIQVFKSLKHLKRLGFGLCSRIHQSYNFAPLVPLQPFETSSSRIPKARLDALEFGGHMSRFVLESMLSPSSMVDISWLRVVTIHADSWVTLSAFLRGYPEVAARIESFMWVEPRFAISSTYPNIRVPPDVTHPLSPALSQINKSCAPFDLHIIPNLRNVCFRISALSLGSSELEWVVRSLTNGSIPRTISVLTIIIQSVKTPIQSPMCGPASVAHICKFFQKSGLEGALFRADQPYTLLRSVNIFVDAFDGSGSEGRLSNGMTQALPILAKNGMLSVALCDKDEILARIHTYLPAHW